MSKPVAVVSDLWGYMLSIDWSEPWLWFLVGFHVMCSLLTMITVIFNCHNTQIALFVLFLGLVYCAEYINEWAAENYRLFSSQQYFDDKGMFISLLLSTPLLINCFVVVLHWMLSTIRTMIQLKRAKLRVQMSQTQSDKDKWLTCWTVALQIDSTGGATVASRASWGLFLTLRTTGGQNYCVAVALASTLLCTNCLNSWFTTDYMNWIVYTLYRESRRRLLLSLRCVYFAADIRYVFDYILHQLCKYFWSQPTQELCYVSKRCGLVLLSLSVDPIPGSDERFAGINVQHVEPPSARMIVFTT